jgi:hypothetical protein
MTRTSYSFALVDRASRAAFVGLAALCIATPVAAQSAPAPAVIHACYVPLTGTVYRIKEDGLRTTCSSTSHIEFQWTDGDGALRPTGAAAGDLLQFDGTQWKPVNAQSVGGVTGYEVATLTANNSYEQQASLVILSSQEVSCNIVYTCRTYSYVYRVRANAVTVTLTCPAGKKAFGVFAAGDIGSDILADGQVNVVIPYRERSTPTQTMLLQPGVGPNPYTLPNQFPGQPSTAPDNVPVKLICANAS